MSKNLLSGSQRFPTAVRADSAIVGKGMQHLLRSGSWQLAAGWDFCFGLLLLLHGWLSMVVGIIRHQCHTLSCSDLWGRV